MINVFNLRGNQRTSGELSRREGGKIFGSGSRTPIAITLLVRNPAAKGKAQIHYHDIGDYLSREEKLERIKKFVSVLSPEMKLSSITPNEENDWLNQRDGVFDTFIPIGDKDNKDGKTIFVPCYSCGVKTNRDSWVYNFSESVLTKNISSMIDFYNGNVDELMIAQKNEPETSPDDIIKLDPTKISWTRGLRHDFEKLRKHPYRPECLRIATYRPFVKMHYYFDRNFNDMIYQIPRLFPTPQTKNLVICIQAPGGKNELTPLMTDCLPDLHLNGDVQAFPLFYFEEKDDSLLNLFDSTDSSYIRHDGISDFALARARQLNPKISKEDIFYYVYGLLHSKHYCSRFSADLKKTLPRIPFPEDYKVFKAYLNAGKKLAELHVNYESAEPWSDAIVTGDTSSLNVEKMRFAKADGEDDKRTIIINPRLKVENIPLLAYDYIINGKSALEWVMERYSYSVHPESKIANNPNAWGEEHGDSRYIVNLLLRIITISVETIKITSTLPALTFPQH